MAHLCNSKANTPPRPVLPAFSRTRRQWVMVPLWHLSSLRIQLLVLLLIQFSTLLLVIAGPVPPAPTPLLRMESSASQGGAAP